MEKNTPGKWVSMVNIEYRDVLEGANNKFTKMKYTLERHNSIHISKF